MTVDLRRVSHEELLRHLGAALGWAGPLTGAELATYFD